MKFLILICLLLFSTIGFALNADNVKVEGFLDTYYAYDINKPQADREFTTQPARHNEFNINLVQIGLSYDDEKVRGKFSLQAGTSVESNYAAEPVNGIYSNNEMVKYIQEAYLGYQVAKNTWVDAGIFFSHIGLESFISQNNPTYTRSLVGDYSPYYQAGVKLSHKFNEKLSGQILILNGWQIVTDNNSQKSLGTNLTYNFSDNTKLSYNTYIGKEAEFRHFHDFVFSSYLSERFMVATQIDFGFQDGAVGQSDSEWFGATVIFKNDFNKKQSLSLRFEYFSDEDGVVTGAAMPFNVFSSSLGYDQKLNETAMWRIEYRHYFSEEEIYTKETGLTKTNGVFVSSLSLKF